MDGLFLADDNRARCWWSQATPLYRLYHDTAWGFPVHDDHRLFEKLSTSEESKALSSHQSPSQ